MISSKEVVERDLEYICGSLMEELGQLSVQNLLITGGAEFLGLWVLFFTRWAGCKDNTGVYPESGRCWREAGSIKNVWKDSHLQVGHGLPSASSGWWF